MLGLFLLAMLIGVGMSTLLFVVIPMIFAFCEDERAAAAAGLTNARAVAKRRFYIPSRKRALHAALLDRIAWVERWTYPVHEKHALRITAVRSHSLQFEDGSTFEPRSMSKAFADGDGAAKGVMKRGAETLPALVVVA